jgi:hypothetical protein
MDNSEIKITIRTSEAKWKVKLADAYKNRKAFIFIDDANLGIDPSNQTLLDMGWKTKTTIQEWVAVLVAVGMSGVGVWMVAAAIIDQEPTSRLGLLIGGGVICIAVGGLSAIRILTKLRPPNVKAGPGGVEFSWDK